MALTPSTIDSHSRQLPQRLFGYEIIEFLGTGAASSIYAASHPDTKQICALKYVVRRTDRDDRFIEQLQTEYEVGRQVKHAGLRRCIEMRANRNWFHRINEAALIMELFDGMPLDSQAAPPLRAAVACFIQAGQALGSLHQLGFIHCDLKPNNILLAADGSVKIIDLGQACRAGTKKERIQGTPDFMAPEQVKCEPMTVRTDVYNLGATMYWTLCGKRLPTLFNISRSANSFLLDDQVATPHDLKPEVPLTLSTLVMDCVKSNPDKRPPDMEAIIRRLEVVDFTLAREQDLIPRAEDLLALEEEEEASTPEIELKTPSGNG